MDIKTFDRVEKKYLIDKSAETKLLKAIKKYLQKDTYFNSEISNIYYDTDNYDLIIKSIDNPDFKEKLRARAYGGYDKVFLEIKTKFKKSTTRVGYKRRFLMSHDEFNKVSSGENSIIEIAARNIETPSDIQIAREADYLIKTLNLKPKLLIYYDRTSYVGEKGLRITFDKNLRFRDTDLSFTRKINDRYYFDTEKNIIMEIKVRGAMPLWLARALSENKIFPVRFSKIGKIYELIKEGEQNV
ncbi:polyphosphate polymerase domain-containing protein [Candidatus Saccharibacteria bacterium]|nr:polyphosphate polymerase domain-containing protein [Candidatus Saccharibacteria bacterium]